MRSALSPDGAGRQRWIVRAARQAALALLAGTLLLGGAPAARAQKAPPEGFGDLVARVAPAVVNISTRKDVASQAEQPNVPMPQFPPGSPFEEFFKEFFDR